MEHGSETGQSFVGTSQPDGVYMGDGRQGQEEVSQPFSTRYVLNLDDQIS